MGHIEQLDRDHFATAAEAQRMVGARLSRRYYEFVRGEVARLDAELGDLVDDVFQSAAYMRMALPW